MLLARKENASITMKIEIVSGDLLDQKTQVIVNAWNRNIIPWWLLWPHGVSGAIKKRGGLAPFREVAKFGPIPLGGAVCTGAGTLPFQNIIHVAGINAFWQASEYSIRQSVRSAMELAEEKKFYSIAFPVIGAGAGNFPQERALKIMCDEFEKIESNLHIVIVRYQKH